MQLNEWLGCLIVLIVVAGLFLAVYLSFATQKLFSVLARQFPDRYESMGRPSYLSPNPARQMRAGMFWQENLYNRAPLPSNKKVINLAARIRRLSITFFVLLGVGMVLIVFVSM